MSFKNHYEPLIPHEYPLWIIAGMSGCFTIFLLFLLQLPLHFQINAQFKAAEHSFKTLQYSTAYKSYATLLEQFPSCRKVKLRIAQSLFSMETKDNHNLALEHIGTMALDRNEWNELKLYMPTEYTSYFKESIKIS